MHIMYTSIPCSSISTNMHYHMSVGKYANPCMYIFVKLLLFYERVVLTHNRMHVCMMCIGRLYMHATKMYCMHTNMHMH